MARGVPSLTALLGLVAVAGYQNRDKIAEWLRHAGGPAQTGGPAQAGGAPHTGAASGQVPGNLGGLLGGTSISEVLGGGLRDLVNAFKQSGHGEVADSWVGSGPNKQIGASDLEKAIPPDVLNTLAQQTGLSRDEILSRLAKNLPEAVDRHTPDGRLPTAADLSRA
jgi:uncharacterized protein YidB (DUF937 family)